MGKVTGVHLCPVYSWFWFAIYMILDQLATDVRINLTSTLFVLTLKSEYLINTVKSYIHYSKFQSHFEATGTYEKGMNKKFIFPYPSVLFTHHNDDIFHDHCNILLLYTCCF